MKARDLMTPDPFVVLPDEPVLRAAEIMRDHDVGVVPVVESRESRLLLGVITDRDLAVRHVAGAHHHDCPVRDHMTADHLVAVRPSDGAGEVMDRMADHKVRRVMVTDDGGRLLGVIAPADLLREEGEEHPRRVERVLAEISEPIWLLR